MLLEEIKGLVFFDIMETIERKFESISWKNVGGIDTGIGMVKGVQVQLKLAPLSFHNANGINITFALRDGDGNFSEVSGTLPSGVKQASEIIGAVANASIDRLHNYDWDFVIMIAKDNVATRLKLYTRIANRIKTTIRTPEMFEHHGFWGGDAIVALAKKGSTFIFDKFDEATK